MHVGARDWKYWAKRADVIFLLIAVLLPALDMLLPKEYKVGDLMAPIFIFAILGLGLNIVTGFTGLLNLGVAAFMAIGAYSYGILTSEIFPYRLGFWSTILIVPCVGALTGLILGAPTLRLRGDYLAIVTLGFGEIVLDTLKNLETITKGTQSISPIPKPMLWEIPPYYIFLFVLAIVVVLNRNLENSRLGRAWMSIREDELASTCMGINPLKTKLLAFATGAALCSLSGALYAAMLGSTGEPNNYDFQVSIIALCICIVGGMGNINGVLLGALVMIGMDSIVLSKLNAFLMKKGLSSTDNVISAPTNWKMMIFGLALVLMMRFKPEGLMPSRRVKMEMHHDEEDKPTDGEETEVKA